YLSRDLRALHSFPTRRSSDLCVAGSSVPAALAAFLRRPLLELRDELLDLDPQSFQRREDLRLELALELFAFLEEVLHQVAEPIRDRKSTRLNSSHVSISYAVF